MIYLYIMCLLCSSFIAFGQETVKEILQENQK